MLIRVFLTGAACGAALRSCLKDRRLLHSYGELVRHLQRRLGFVRHTLHLLPQRVRQLGGRAGGKSPEA